jgi:hypothetical protein
MSRITLIIALVLPLAVVACEESKPTTEQKLAASAPLTDEQLDQTMIPVKADFEEEAVTTITEDNVESEVDRLEQQITADIP